jgi:hypothetical protein
MAFVFGIASLAAVQMRFLGIRDGYSANSLTAESLMRHAGISPVFHDRIDLPVRHTASAALPVCHSTVISGGWYLIS